MEPEERKPTGGVREGGEYIQKQGDLPRVPCNILTGALPDRCAALRRLLSQKPQCTSDDPAGVETLRGGHIAVQGDSVPEEVIPPGVMCIQYQGVQYLAFTEPFSQKSPRRGDEMTLEEEHPPLPEHAVGEDGLRQHRPVGGDLPTGFEPPCRENQPLITMDAVLPWEPGLRFLEGEGHRGEEFPFGEPEPEPPPDRGVASGRFPAEHPERFLDRPGIVEGRIGMDDGGVFGSGEADPPGDLDRPVGRGVFHRHRKIPCLREASGHGGGRVTGGPVHDDQERMDPLLTRDGVDEGCD